ncbi:hypothetical protein [Peptostreptococcus equinus]|uniref:Uncharacterized protein n=1 Tax=Peptostreptococcus equinus TaxID=3003601 RepID=A0ABY7JUN6_9FIRM|nr:hypothetical protein [Peptostreptococcus sp. CBA3647]WAW15427.1 hypothetical protein O0R46_02995 [Peptostreptococcus sp. CBA3647]
MKLDITEAEFKKLFKEITKKNLDIFIKTLKEEIKNADKKMSVNDFILQSIANSAKMNNNVTYSLFKEVFSFSDNDSTK